MSMLQFYQPAALFDHWASWLLQQRHGDDAEILPAASDKLGRYADKILDASSLRRGSRLLDLGTGDGLLAFRALDRMNGQLRVVMADSSPSILRLAGALAAQHGYADQCRQMQVDAQDLAGIADGSMDAVVTRSVIAYVPDKAAAFRAMHRVLQPGGRLSIGEPIMRDDGLHAIALRRLLSRRDRTQEDRMLPLLHRWKAAQFPDTLEQLEAAPHTNFTERDLLSYAQEAGFTDIDLRLQMHVETDPAMTWSTFINLTPHPLAPSLASIMRSHFSAEERVLFERSLRPAVEAGAYATTDRIAYLSATKPVYN